MKVGFEDGTELSFRGFIDRIDVNGDGNYRVIDYKTASSLPSATNLKKGARLQLPLYAKAVEDALKAVSLDGFYWSLGSQNAGTLNWLSSELRMPANRQDHIQAEYERIRAGDFVEGA